MKVKETRIVKTPLPEFCPDKIHDGMDNTYTQDTQCSGQPYFDENGNFISNIQKRIDCINKDKCFMYQNRLMRDK